MSLLQVTSSSISPSSSSSSSLTIPTTLLDFKILQKLREEGDVHFIFLRTLLDLLSLSSSSSSSYNYNNPSQYESIVFHCVTGFRHVTLCSWDHFSIEFRTVARDFLFSLGFFLKKKDEEEEEDKEEEEKFLLFPRTLLMTSLYTAATFWKKSWWDYHQYQHHNNQYQQQQQQQQQHLKDPIITAREKMEQMLIQAMKDHTRIHLQSFTSTKQLLDTLESYMLMMTLSTTTTSTMTENDYTIFRANQATIFLIHLVNEFSGSSLKSSSSSSEQQQQTVLGNTYKKNSTNSSSSSTTYYHSSLEIHQSVHDIFESSSDLTRVFYMTIQSLGNIVGSEFLKFHHNTNNNTHHITQKTPFFKSSFQSLSSTSSTSSSSLTLWIEILSWIQQLVILSSEVLSWDFGSHYYKDTYNNNNNNNNNTISSALIRPPKEWNPLIIQPEFLTLLFQLYSTLRRPFQYQQQQQQEQLQQQQQQQQSITCLVQHDLRQFLLLLSSITGSIFVDTYQTCAYFEFFIQQFLGILTIMIQDSSSSTTCTSTSSRNTTSTKPYEILQSLEGEIVDMALIVLKLIVNLKTQGISKLPSFEAILNAIVTISTMLLYADVQECKDCKGDFESMQGFEWRSEALATLLEACSLLSEDFWIQGNIGTLSSSSSASCMSPTYMDPQRLQKQLPQRTEDATRVYFQLSTILSPLYTTFIQCRIDIAKMEECYLTIHHSELDDDREDIYATIMDEEMKMVAIALGRLNVLSSCHFLYSRMQECFPRVMHMFSFTSTSSSSSSLLSTSSMISPDAAVLLEEARLLIICAGHLLTDECEGETPQIPTAVVSACSVNQESTTSASIVMNITFAIKSLIESQASSLAIDSNNIHLSPLLAKTSLWFFNRWIPGYFSSDNSQPCSLISIDTTHNIIEFLLAYCWHILCYWPLENCVQETIGVLLLSMAKCGPSIRHCLMVSQNFFLIVMLHCASASLSHHCTEHDITRAIINMSSMNISISTLEPSLTHLVKAYHRVAYTYRARVLTFIVMILGKSEGGNQLSEAMLQQVYISIQNPFLQLIDLLRRDSVHANHLNTRELVHLLIELFDGVAKVNDLTCGETSVSFLTPLLNSLASLMALYAKEQLICESLLHFFRDYAENFIFILNQEQSLALFNSTSVLLKSYSTETSRSVLKTSSGVILTDTEEEQKYHDVLYAIQLLIHIGSKDFVDTCGTSEMGDVIDFVFYGLQQIIPLMTEGLLHFQKLAFQYFSLVGFIMDVYAEKLCALPYDLFQSLVDSLLFGMCHVDPLIAKSSLGGLSGLARELGKNESFRSKLNDHRPDLIESLSYRLLRDVILQPLIWDRLEAAGIALLPLAVMDLERFAKVVQSLCSQLDSLNKQNRFRQSFEKLLHLDVLTKFSSSRGLDGRMNRLLFKNNFEAFVREIHSFLIVK